MSANMKILMAENETKAKLSELATAGQDIQWNLNDTGKNPDELIASKGMEYIEKIEKDTHIASQLATRRQKLIKKEYRIKPAGKNGKATAKAIEIADFVQWNLDAMDGSFLKDMEAMLDSISKGFSITEINYCNITRGRWKGKTGLASLRCKPARYFEFRFDKYAHYTLVQTDPDPTGTELPLNKFIHMISGPNDENPYGDGVTAKCAFWSWLKTNGAKFNAIFLERYGMPLIKVEMPANPDNADLSKANEIIAAVYKTSGIRVPKGFIIDLLEAKRTGDAQYDNFIERANKEMSKVILGATLTTEEGKRGQGSYALGHEHVGIMEDYIVFDAAMTSQAINEQLIKRLVDYNYDTEDYPKFEWIGINIDSFISFAQGISVLVDKGFKVPISYVRDQTGIPEPRGDEEILKSAVNSQQPAVKPLGPDNRSFRFAEDQDDEIGKLVEQYKNRAGSLWEVFKNKLKSIKKKV